MKATTIGLDIDDTVLDFTRFRKKMIYQALGANILLEDCNEKHLENYGLDNAYCQLKKELHERCVREGQALPDSLACIKWLQNRYDVFFITGRNNTDADYAREWLEQHKVSAPVLATDSKPKAVIAERLGVRVFLDDDPRVADGLAEVVQCSFRLIGARDRAITVGNPGVTTVSSWREFHEQLGSIPYKHKHKHTQRGRTS